MAEHGPMPKRPEERRRRNKADAPTDTVEMRGSVEVPPSNPRWHTLALQLYEALETSGQSRFFEPSDWAAAQVLAESLSRDLKQQVIGVATVKKTDLETGFKTETPKVVKAYLPIKGASMAAYLKAFAALGVSEGDRRRIGIFVKRSSEKPPLASVTAMDDARNLLGG